MYYYNNGTTSYSYDKNGNLLKEEGYHNRTYVYDKRNRLKSIETNPIMNIDSTGYVAKDIGEMLTVFGCIAIIGMSYIFIGILQKIRVVSTFNQIDEYVTSLKLDLLAYISDIESYLNRADCCLPH